MHMHQTFFCPEELGVLPSSADIEVELFVSSPPNGSIVEVVGDGLVVSLEAGALLCRRPSSEVTLVLDNIAGGAVAVVVRIF